MSAMIVTARRPSKASLYAMPSLMISCGWIKCLNASATFDKSAGMTCPVRTALRAADWCGPNDRCEVMGEPAPPYIPETPRAESIVEADERTALTMSRRFTPLPENDIARWSNTEVAAPGGRGESVADPGKGKEWVDSIDLRPDSLWKVL